MRREVRTKLAAAIARDILRDDVPSGPDTADCHVCGRGMVDRGWFCSARCRDAYDAGFPIRDPHQSRKFLEVPLRDWKIVAGPPGVAIGSSYYGSILDALRDRRRPTTTRSKKVVNGLATVTG